MRVVLTWSEWFHSIQHLHSKPHFVHTQDTLQHWEIFDDHPVLNQRRGGIPSAMCNQQQCIHRELVFDRRLACDVKIRVWDYCICQNQWNTAGQGPGFQHFLRSAVHKHIVTEGAYHFQWHYWLLQTLKKVARLHWNFSPEQDQKRTSKLFERDTSNFPLS